MSAGAVHPEADERRLFWLWLIAALLALALLVGIICWTADQHGLPSTKSVNAPVAGAGRFAPGSSPKGV